MFLIQLHNCRSIIPHSSSPPPPSSSYSQTFDVVDVNDPVGISPNVNATEESPFECMESGDLDSYEKLNCEFSVLLADPVPVIFKNGSFEKSPFMDVSANYDDAAVRFRRLVLVGRWAGFAGCIFGVERSGRGQYTLLLVSWEAKADLDCLDRATRIFHCFLFLACRKRKKLVASSTLSHWMEKMAFWVRSGGLLGC